MKQPRNATTTNRLPNPAYGLALIFLVVLAGFGLTALLNGDESPATAVTSETVVETATDTSEPADVETVNQVEDLNDEDTNDEEITETETEPETEEPVSVPCIFDGGGGTTTTSWTNTEGSATSAATVVTGIDTFRFGSCIRTVIELSSSFPLFGEEPVPATLLPSDIVVASGTATGVSMIDFGELVEEASAVAARFDDSEAAQSTFVYRTEARTLAGDIYGPSSALNVEFDNSNGAIIIDVADPDGEQSGATPVLDESGVIIRSIEAGLDNSVTVTGYARPFEANLGVEVLADGTAIDVGWAREDEATSATNGIPTTDWVSALGYFEFTIEPDASIDLSDIVIRLDPEGGNDNPTEVDLVLADLLS